MFNSPSIWDRLFRNAPCPPASWVDSRSLHPWHCVWIRYAAVPGADWVCCQWEQHSRSPSGCGESGRPGQRDRSGSGKSQNRLIVKDLSDHLTGSVWSLLLSSVSIEVNNKSVYWQWPVRRPCLQKLPWNSLHLFWLYVLHMGVVEWVLIFWCILQNTS